MISPAGKIQIQPDMSLLTDLKYYYFKNYYFRRFIRLVRHNRNDAAECQEKTLSYLLKQAAVTAFGKDHSFNKINNYQDFRKQVPARSYEDFSIYTARIFNKEENVLWPGLPVYFGKSSGTVSGPKYIPVTKEYLTSTQYAARYMIANLITELRNTDFIGGKVFYQADPQVFEIKNGFKCASISAIKSHQMPNWAQLFSLPGKEIGQIKDLILRLDKTIEAMEQQKIKIAVALPVWLLHFLQEFEKKTGKKFRSQFPLFKILFVSGMNYEPYESLIRQHMGNDILLLENYTATEGNFAYQCQPGKKGMELICNQGIFYEFIPLEQAQDEDPERIQLKEVKVQQQYVLLISTNCGLWAYRVNDIVEFISVKPYRIVVSGRLNDIFSPFGEHLLPIQAEQAMAAVCKQMDIELVDFTILPGFDSTNGHHYICYTEFEKMPVNTESFSRQLHKELSERNDYYNEFNMAGIVLPPRIIQVRQKFFRDLSVLNNKNGTAQQKNRHLINDPSLKNIFSTLNEQPSK